MIRRTFAFAALLNGLGSNIGTCTCTALMSATDVGLQIRSQMSDRRTGDCGSGMRPQVDEPCDRHGWMSRRKVQSAHETMTSSENVTAGDGFGPFLAGR